jgi:hypothetical protein
VKPHLSARRTMTCCARDRLADGFGRDRQALG